MNKQNLIILTVALFSLVLGVSVYLSQRDDFSSVQGDTYQWHALNHKTVVVNYFAEWCAPCLKEVPELNAFTQWVNTQPNIEFFAVSYDDLPDQELDRIIQQYNMKFPVVGATGDSFPLEKPNYLPATFILHQGDTSKPLLGEQTLETLIQAIELFTKK